MAEAARIISLSERLKSRREQRGISQAQAARELDVARTAYRLWEMEAAKPAPDRWRLIASWLGVSVTTMLLAEDLLSEDEAAMGELATFDFERSGRDWDDSAAANTGGFFEQARSLVDDGARSGDISAEQAAALTFVLERIKQESSDVDSERMDAGRASTHAPRKNAGSQGRPRCSRVCRRRHTAARARDGTPAGHRTRRQQRQTWPERPEGNRRAPRQRHAEPPSHRGRRPLSHTSPAQGAESRRRLRPRTRRRDGEPLGSRPTGRAQRHLVRARPAGPGHAQHNQLARAHQAHLARSARPPERKPPIKRGTV